MSNRSSQTAPPPRDESGKRITPVVMNADAMMPANLKYPNGFISNIALVNKPLLEQAAQELGLQLEFAVPRFHADPAEFAALYLENAAQHARALLHRFNELQIARAMQRSD